MLRLFCRAAPLLLPLTIVAGCAEPEHGPTVDNPPVLVPAVVDPRGSAPPTTVALIRCDDGGASGGVVLDGVCV